MKLFKRRKNEVSEPVITDTEKTLANLAKSVESNRKMLEKCYEIESKNNKLLGKC